MRMDIIVKTGKKDSKVIKKAFADYEVWVKSKPVAGAANKELIEVLSSYFNVNKNHLRIVRGFSIPVKVIEMSE